MGNDTPTATHSVAIFSACLARDGKHIICGRVYPNGDRCGRRLATLFPDWRRDPGSIHHGAPRQTGGPIAAGPGDDFTARWLPRESDYPGADGPLGSVYLLDEFAWNDGLGCWAITEAAERRLKRDHAIAAGREWACDRANAAKMQADARRRLRDGDAVRHHRPFGRCQSGSRPPVSVDWGPRDAERGDCYLVRCPQCGGTNSTRFVCSLTEQRGTQ